TYHVVGDLAATMALLVKADQQSFSLSLKDTINSLLEIQGEEDEVKKMRVLSWWRESDRETRFVINKLLTGGWRIGVSQKNLIKALSKYNGQEESVIAHRLMGNWDPKTTSYSELMESELNADASKPYPFYLAYALEGDVSELGSPEEWQIEWKWDGIRGQVIYRNGEVFIWTRGEELVTEKYPEIVEFASQLPDGTSLDGEIVVHNGDQVLPFSLLQKRIGRKTVGKKILADAPIKFIAYDVLESNGEDIRTQEQSARRIILEEIQKTTNHPNFLISQLLVRETWKEYQELREQSRQHYAEGFMLKRKSSNYQMGRKRGDWWKWKVDPLTIDAVLIYAMRGHGRRANLFTDYTFAVWEGDQLVPFAKAYSGLTDAEFKEVDKFVKKNTIEKFGPVRSVTPQLVFELAFEGIAESSRHKSGIALRFPRMHRWRKDKPSKAANTLADLKGLLNEYGT
ncbi:MAG: ATP-dependent DNA ligase, partial [Flavobacteriales bacterium]|nr:ATP-dependent DNA ligase [Flavobacteriales bacterium]